ncbi:MAG TPA: ATP-binding protein, partial [Bryobacteraceae bacterium]|nr:ATP-binding protein [Bryobacteraceae bacterium]
GGVAHDFNNLLTVILGFSDLVLSGADRSTATYSQVEQIRVAAERAASLTQQLLAFSRKQMLQPKVINLNSVVMEIEKMLRRLMGDDIELTTILARDLGQVRADPTQIEQVIMNLAVNARDAMPRGGRLTIETANVELSEEYAREHVEARAGPHVMLAITDTGIGMDQTTKERIFEPFFTTKEYGKGTGLGLSTVFGIVKQSGGSLWVYSEPGQGSVFKIYLPRVEEAVVEAPEIEAPDARGTETILVVEDDEKVRLLVRTVLSARGYTVFEAAKPSEALMFQHRYTGPIHLLLTDVVLPEMSGQELSEKLLALHPRLKVLFMSGYTDRSISLGTAAFIQKPFTPEALGRKIREVLEGR